LGNEQLGHKPGKLVATNEDYTTEKSTIYDPETCNRQMPGYNNYSEFLGFHQVKPPNN
jgi:hypothetical protein